MNTIQTSGISSLKSAIIAGIDSWTRAGEEVVKLLDSGMSLHDIEAEANCEFINANRTGGIVWCKWSSYRTGPETARSFNQ